MRLKFLREPASLRLFSVGLGLVTLGLAAGCERQPPSVVIYTSVDQQFAERVLADFE